MFLFLRELIAVFFIISAIFKLVGIDDFEIYIYSISYTSLSSSLFLSRLIISIELLLGLYLFFGIYIKKTIISSFVIILLFSLFLFYLIISKHEEHCHCLGEFVKLNHYQSLIKNAVILLLLGVLFKKTKESFNIRNKTIIIALSLFSVSIPFIISPPDNFISENSIKKGYNPQELNQFLQQNKLEQEDAILCFYGSSCQFCKLAAKKITIMINKTGESDAVHQIFWNDEKEIMNFYNETNTPQFDHTIISPNQFLKITNGSMPLIIILKDGEVYREFGYRNVDEKEILSFLHAKSLKN